jgi:hypothetical protein
MLCLEPFTALLTGHARMAKLPFDYLSEGLACPLARLGSTKDLYYLMPLRICALELRGSKSSGHRLR